MNLPYSGKQLTRPKLARQIFGFANLRNKYLYVIGGWIIRGKKTVATGIVHYYDIGRDFWIETRQVPELKQARAACSTCTLGDAVYVFGGHLDSESRYLNSIEKLNHFDPPVKGNEWRHIVLPEPIFALRKNALMCRISQKEIMILGGWERNKSLNDAIIFDTVADSVQYFFEIEDESFKTLQ